MSSPQKTCSFIKPDGVICKMVASTDRDVCWRHDLSHQRTKQFHDAVIQRRCEMAKYALGVTTQCKVPGNDELFDDMSAGLFNSLQLPMLDDAPSIQLVLGAVVHGLLNQVIPARNAKLAIHALQIAAYNLKKIHPPMSSLDKVATTAAPTLPDFNHT